VAAAWDDAGMNDDDAIEQLRDDILEVFPPGPQRDVWLAWLAQLENDCMWWGAKEQPILH
jgi:hypothetical protein